MFKLSKPGMTIIVSVSAIVLVIFSAAAIVDPGGVVIADEILDFLGSILECFVHENERQIVEHTLTRIV